MYSGACLECWRNRGEEGEGGGSIVREENGKAMRNHANFIAVADVKFVKTPLET